MKRKKLALCLALLLVLGGGLFWFVTTLSDLRPVSLRKVLSPEERQSGKALLHALEQAHGGYENWKARRSWSFEQDADWYGFPNSLFRRWPANPQRYRLQGTPGIDDAVLTLLNGPHPGERWKLQGGRLYQENGGQFVQAENPGIQDKIVYKNYWFQLPFRLREADVLVDAGEETIQGQAYQRLYATWGDGSPNAEFDQFLVYIHPQSHLLEWLHFTVREKGAFIAIHARFSDFRTVDGITLPFKQEVRSGPPSGEGFRLHENRYLSVAWAQPDSSTQGR